MSTNNTSATNSPLPRPEVSPQQLTGHLTPSARYLGARFENYQPNPEFPSQAQARDTLQAFVSEIAKPEEKGLWAQMKAALSRAPRPSGKGLYLDGGFGVGKTHLLASSYWAAQERGMENVAIMSFQDLMYLIGALGMKGALQTFGEYRLLLIDEFELDDPGNTHMANTFLGGLMPAGTHVIATSNTEPEALGKGRFNAEDFARQIQGISERFVSLAVDGPDYRQRGTKPAQPLTEAEWAWWQQRIGQQKTGAVTLTHAELNKHLLMVHPSQFAKMLEDIPAIGICELSAMTDQGTALRFVHFIDKVYDLGKKAAFSGIALEELFHETYRHGAFGKKYSRALSRLSELLREAREQMKTQMNN